MRGRMLIALLAVAGVLVAASIGYAAYLASRDSVGLPVTKLDPAPTELAPTVPRRTRPRRSTTTTTATRAETTDDHGGRTTTGEDHSGRGRGGSGSSGHGGGGGDD
jgi:uncharacterized membrane protein YgcG